MCASGQGIVQTTFAQPVLYEESRFGRRLRVTCRQAGFLRPTVNAHGGDSAEGTGLKVTKRAWPAGFFPVGSTAVETLFPCIDPGQHPLRGLPPDPPGVQIRAAPPRKLSNVSPPTVVAPQFLVGSPERGCQESTRSNSDRDRLLRCSRAIALPPNEAGSRVTLTAAISAQRSRACSIQRGSMR